MTWFVTDQGSHFKNVPHSYLIRKFRSKKIFTTAYSPWANGTVERVNCELPRETKALLSEWHLDVQDRPAVVECIQSVLNQAPLKHLRFCRPSVYRPSLEVSAAIKPSREVLCAPVRSGFSEAASEGVLRV